VNKRLETLFGFLEKDPVDSFTLYGIALEYLSIKDYKNAEKYLNKIFESDPDYVPAYMQLAQLRENQNEIDEAKNIYKKGIEIAKKTGDAHAAKEMEDFLDDLE
jgi:Tfp pilus assembly protein PilF